MSLDDDLIGATLTSGLTAAQRAELLAVASEVTTADGDELFVENDPADFLWVLLEGRLELSRQNGLERVVIATMSTPGQWAGGLQAWADDGGAGYRATGRAAGPGRVLQVPSAELGRLVTDWFPFGRHLIAGIYGTVRGIEATARQRDSLVALGTLAAGLAHEINNPAAASLRAVEALRVTSDTMLTSLTRLAELTISADQFVGLNGLRLAAEQATAPTTGALATADREEAIGAWLSQRGLDRAWQLAAQFTAAGVDRGWCEQVDQVVEGPALAPALEWVASTLECKSLLAEVHDTTSRISELVAQVKSYSQMDRTSLQDVDIREGIESTLVMLSHKLSGIEIVRLFDDPVPIIPVFAGELNQVWTNLIDNAVDAMDGSGTLTLAAHTDGSNLIVDIADTGSGMPPEVQAHAFEPFFTTKGVGKGTGLGLDISRRIITERHSGEITFDTSPSGTTAHVRIPLPAD